MDKTFKDYINMLKEVPAEQSVLVEEFQGAASETYPNDVAETDPFPNQWLDAGDEVVQTEEDIYDPNQMFDPNIEMFTPMMSMEQKKTLLIEYYSKLIDKIKIVRDHIDLISFDTILSSDTIGISEIQFNLEELKRKVEKYIEDQFIEDKYERALYLYLSFMEELKLNTKLLNRQVKTKTNQKK